MYIGDGLVVEAPETGLNIMITPLNGLLVYERRRRAPHRRMSRRLSMQMLPPRPLRASSAGSWTSGEFPQIDRVPVAEGQHGFCTPSELPCRLRDTR
jgi:hypothetical protein